MGVLLVSHDFGVIAQVCDRVAVMYGGYMVETAPVEAIYKRGAASLHPRAAGVDPKDRVGGALDSAAGHPRHAARPDRATAGVCIRASLSLRAAELQLGLDGAGSGGSRPCERLPSTPFHLGR